MITARNGATATLLGELVFVAGGSEGKSGESIATTEMYEEGTDTWTLGPTMAVSRFGHSALRLVDGRVLLAGGTINPAPAELYDPVSGTLTPTGADLDLYRPELAAIDDGRVFVVGAADARLFDPTNDSWTALPAPPIPLLRPRIFAHGDRVAVFAHRTSAEDPELGGFDPDPHAFWLDASGSWTPIAGGGCYGVGHFVLPLRDSRVFLFGGGDLDQESSCTSIIDLETETWRESEPMSATEYFFVTIRPGVGVLVSGGLLFIRPDDGEPEYFRGPLAYPTVVPVRDGALLAVGGFEGDGVATDDVYFCE